MRRVQLRRPNVTPSIKRKLLDDFDKILDSARFIMGPYLAGLEAEFSSKVGSKTGTGVSSATAGLHLSMIALGVTKGDEVVVPTKTFVSTANAVVFCGGKPVFCDCQEDTMNMDPKVLRKLISPKTKAVIPVHIAGQPCDMDEIKEICDSKSVDIVEDSAHAPYAMFKGRCAGTFGKIGVYSFYPDKVIGSADGGMVVTDDESIAEKIRLLRNCGRTTVGDDNIQLIGYNYRMNEFQAAIALAQLRVIDSMIAKRNELARYYDKTLSGIPGLVTPRRASNRTHDYYAYVIRLVDMERNQFRKRMMATGIETSPMFDPVHLLKPYVELYGKRVGLCPVAERISPRNVTIPLHPQLARADAEYVVDSISTILGRN